MDESCSFFDLQINGYAGVDFNCNGLTLESLRSACDKLKQDGVKGILATIITADIEDMKSRLQRIVELRREDKQVEQMIYGFHIEGPFINSEPGFRGAHPPEKICPVDTDKMEYLLDAAEGLTRIVTLAPEVDEHFRLTRMLTKNKIVVSAGHCDPTIGVLRSAIDSGLSMFTHLGNGCPQSLNRHDNIIQRVLSLREDLWICLIADGIHIPFFALKNYLAMVGHEKSIIVTDAMAAAGAGPGRYTLSNLVLEVGEDRVVREPGKPNFAGSAISMKRSKVNLTDVMRIDEVSACKMVFDNPMKALGVQGEI